MAQEADATEGAEPEAETAETAETAAVETAVLTAVLTAALMAEEGEPTAGAAAAACPAVEWAGQEVSEVLAAEA